MTALQTNDHQATWEAFLRIIEVATENSNGRLRVVRQEADWTTSFRPEVGHFLKFDNRGIGRDLEHYAAMGAGPVGWPMTLVLFLTEVLVWLIEELPGSYITATDALREFGEALFPSELVAHWREAF